MLKTILISFLLSIFTFTSFSQEVIRQSDPQADGNNKKIGMCKLYSDTLLLSDLQDCKQITVNSEQNVRVTSFTFSYYLENNMTLEIIYAFGDGIKQEELDKLKKVKPKQVFLHNVLAESDTEILILGHRMFYLK